ncbi:MAG: ABC transporter permease [bacterium]|nr:ABC transporter permease [bacterium]
MSAITDNRMLGLPGGNLIRGRTRWIIYGLVGIFMLSITQQVAKLPTDDLTSSGTWSIALAWSVPILLAGLGGIFSERSGVVNIGLEGMMILGTWWGAYGTVVVGPWYGMLLALIAGAVGGLIMAIAAVGFNVDHIIAGVAINLMAPGLNRFLSNIHFSDRGGSLTQSPAISGVGNFTVPVLAGGTAFGWDSPDALGALERADWFFVSDLAGVMRGFVFQISWLTLVAYLVVPLSIFVLWRTRFGLRLRSCGEHPHAADSLGVNVYKYKYYGVIISGALAGFGGGFLAVQLSGLYRQGQTLGKGFVGLATVIFGNWNPFGAARGALLFGFTETLRLRDENAAHGLLLLAMIGIGLFVLWRLFRRKGYIGTLQLAIVAIAIGFWYLNTADVPNQLPAITPHIAVLVVLLFATSRLRPPAADGLPYRKGEN